MFDISRTLVSTKSQRIYAVKPMKYLTKQMSVQGWLFAGSSLDNRGHVPHSVGLARRERCLNLAFSDAVH